MWGTLAIAAWLLRKPEGTAGERLSLRTLEDLRGLWCDLEHSGDAGFGGSVSHAEDVAGSIEYDTANCVPITGDLVESARLPAGARPGELVDDAANADEAVAPAWTDCLAKDIAGRIQGYWSNGKGAVIPVSESVKNNLSPASGGRRQLEGQAAAV